MSSSDKSKQETATALSAFPQAVKIANGETLSLRPATPDDKAGIIDFAKGLDETDLLFLRVDITKSKVVSNWLKNIKAGETVSLLAVSDRDSEDESSEQIVGYATVDRNQARWTRRVGEIRVNVAPSYRSQGLGRHLTAKIFDVARRLELRKLVAHMTPEQTGAQAAFNRLGFQSEAMLADFVEDRDGQTHDMLIMSYDIDGFTNQIDEPLQI